jgi:hypothetical protein
VGKIKINHKIACGNVLKNSLLRNVFFLSLTIATVLPIYHIWFIYPSFTKILIESTKNDSIIVAKHLLSMLISEKVELREEIHRAALKNEIEKLQATFKLLKLKLFSRTGEIIFSTDPADLGIINRAKYFQEIIANQQVLAKFIQKNTSSLEGQKLRADVIETYVPVVIEGKLLGAFEIYYDITDRKQQLDSLLSRSSRSLLNLALGLLIAIAIILFRESKTISERTQAEEDRDKRIVELQQAMADFKKVSGLIPICATCKMIRDDQGFWNPVEAFISENSEAKLTHTICPKCADKFYSEHINEG